MEDGNLEQVIENVSHDRPDAIERLTLDLLLQLGFQRFIPFIKREVRELSDKDRRLVSGLFQELEVDSLDHSSMDAVLCSFVLSVLADYSCCKISANQASEIIKFLFLLQAHVAHGTEDSDRLVKEVLLEFFATW